MCVCVRVSLRRYFWSDNEKIKKNFCYKIARFLVNCINKFSEFIQFTSDKRATVSVCSIQIKLRQNDCIRKDINHIKLDII